MGFESLLVLASAGGPGGLQVAVHSWDIVVTVVYLLGVVALGLYAGWRMRHKEKSGGSRDYFLAGGTLRWPIIGLALFATNISCVHLVSLAQSGYDTGLLNGNFEWMAASTLILLSLLFAPFYIRSRVATLPDFLERRYNRTCRDLLAVFSLVSAVTIHIGFSFLTGGIVIEKLFGIEFYTGIFIIASLTALYTIVGGLLAVVLTEAIQTVVLVLGAAVITWFSWQAMGGWGAMVEVLQKPDLLGNTSVDKLSMLRPHGDPSGMPWYAIFLGYPVLGIWYWCADQTIVQRVLGAKDENHARVGPLFASFIKILPVFIFVLPGLLAFTLASSGKLDVSSLENPDVREVGALVTLAAPGRQAVLDEARAAGRLTPEAERVVEFVRNHPERVQAWTRAGVLKGGAIDLASGAEQDLVEDETALLFRAGAPAVVDSKGIYAVMITELLPPGVVGLLVAALLAALMSTVSGALNSISTLVAFDLFQRFKPEARDRTLVTVGRFAAGVAMFLAMGLVPILNRAPGIFNAVNDIIAHLAPPVTCVFLLGVFWKKANAPSAQWTLIVGGLTGVVVYAMNKTMGDASPLHSIPFMMMAFYLLCFCIVVQVAVALATATPVSAEGQRLCWDSPLEPLRGEAWKGIGNYKLLTGILVVVMVALYWAFR
jgi:SSS family transporter